MAPKMTLKEKLMKQKLKTGDVELCGMKAKVRALSGPERLEFGALCDDETPEAIKNRYRYIWRKAVKIGDEVTDEEFNVIFNVDFESIYAAYSKVIEISKMDILSAEEAEKN